MKKVWSITKTIFWAAIVIAALFIIFTTLNIGGYQMFVVKSGSMEPKIKTGSVVIDKKVTTYGVGDVITFKTSNNSTVTHRVYKVDNKNGQTSYVVKGDSNNSPDPSTVNPKNIVGKVWFSVPFLGYLIAFIRTLPGLIIFIILPAIIIIADEISNIKKEAENIKNSKHRKAMKTKDKDDEIADISEKVLTKPAHEAPTKIGQDKEHVQ